MNLNASLAKLREDPKERKKVLLSRSCHLNGKFRSFGDTIKAVNTPSGLRLTGIKAPRSPEPLQLLRSYGSVSNIGHCIRDIRAQKSREYRYDLSILRYGLTKTSAVQFRKFCFQADLPEQGIKSDVRICITDIGSKGLPGFSTCKDEEKFILKVDRDSVMNNYTAML